MRCGSIEAHDCFPFIWKFVFAVSVEVNWDLILDPAADVSSRLDDVNYWFPGISSSLFIGPHFG